MSERRRRKNVKVQPQLASPIRPLDKSGFIPLYYQIQRALMEKIDSGELMVGDPLASEEELARLYQVSRMTARQALHGLKTSGFAFSQKGRGTFVTRPKLEKNIMHLHGFTEDMKHLGMVPSSKLLEQTVVKATEELSQKLKVEPEEVVMRLRRLPWADEVIEALPATREESELLTIPKKASVLSISRIIMTTEETPIEVACSRYRGDRYRASIRVPTTTIE